MMKYLFILLALIFSSIVMGKTYIVKVRSSLGSKKLSELGFKPFSPYQKGYFQNLYIIESKTELKKIKGIQFLKIEDSKAFKLSSLEPGTLNAPFSNDPLVNYQWGTKYNGQRVYSEIDDINSLLIPFEKGSDIQYSIRNKIERKIKKDSVVAIIDSGIDLNHKDLKDNIFYNKAECPNGIIPFGKKIKDNDKNGFKGDCRGWDFTGRRKGDNRPDDLHGHGTHVAGIISAIVNNNLGISGISNRIKILPLKVFSPQSNNIIALTHRLAQAILYAVKMKVDVINLSLGWPTVLDKKYLREAINEALKKNILIVAAAGNNNHSAPIFPCAYEDILCVGSSDPDSSFSSFSNFGSHVDLVAPGRNILSTYPENLLPRLFSQKGYDIKSGTSQSAPYISALAAVLKGMNPSIGQRELKYHLMASTHKLKNEEKKYSMFGLSHFDEALKGKIKKLKFPELKKISMSLFTKEGFFEFPLKLNCSSVNKGSSSYEIKAFGISFENGSGEIGCNETILIKAKLLDINLDRNRSMNFLIDDQNFSHKMILARKVELDKAITKKVFFPKNLSLTSLRTLENDYLKNTKPDYYYQRVVNKKNEIYILTHSKDSLVPLGFFTLPKNSQFVSLHKNDFNYDGKSDYLIRYLDKSKGEPRLFYRFFNNKMKPLFGKLSLWELDFEGVLLNTDNYGFLSYKHKKLGKVAIPAFLGSGGLPKRDQQNDPFIDKDERTINRLYYFKPILSSGRIKLQTRTIDLEKVAIKRFGENFEQKLNLAHMYPQSKKDFYSGSLKLMATYGEGFRKENISFTMKGVSSRAKLKRLKKSYIVSDIFKKSSILSLNKNSSNSQEFVLSGFQDSFHGNIAVVKKNSLIESSVEQRDLSESFLRHVRTFSKNDTLYHFIQTKSEIFLNKQGPNGSENYHYPVHVSSFLGGGAYLEQHYPIPFEIGPGTFAPALYVDSTQITENTIYLTTFDGNKLISPASLNYQVPDTCFSRNPVALETKRKFYFSILCRGKSGVEMFYFPIK